VGSIPSTKKEEEEEEEKDSKLMLIWKYHRKTH
jgi:hypothetical protein